MNLLTSKSKWLGNRIYQHSSIYKGHIANVLFMFECWFTRCRIFPPAYLLKKKAQVSLLMYKRFVSTYIVQIFHFYHDGHQYLIDFNKEEASHHIIVILFSLLSILFICRRLLAFFFSLLPEMLGRPPLHASHLPQLGRKLRLRNLVEKLKLRLSNLVEKLKLSSDTFFQLKV